MTDENRLIAHTLGYGAAFLLGGMAFLMARPPEIVVEPGPTVVRVLPSHNLDPWRVTLEWSDGTLDRREVSKMHLADEAGVIVRFER